MQFQMEIIYGSHLGMALVSPKNEQKFISVLKSMNTQIQVDVEWQ